MKSKIKIINVPGKNINFSRNINISGKIKMPGKHALVSLLIYRKNGWRVRCVGMGFGGGAKALFEHHRAAMPAAPRPPVQARPVPPAKPPLVA